MLCKQAENNRKNVEPISIVVFYNNDSVMTRRSGKYLIGVVAAENPHAIQTLKAQAVAPNMP